MFAKFKEMLKTLQLSISFHEVLELMPKFSKFMNALLKGTNQKVDKAQVNTIEKYDNPMPKALRPKLKDLGKFSISCTIGGMEIPHTLCDLGSSINVIPFCSLYSYLSKDFSTIQIMRLSSLLLQQDQYSGSAISSL